MWSQSNETSELFPFHRRSFTPNLFDWTDTFGISVSSFIPRNTHVKVHHISNLANKTSIHDSGKVLATVRVKLYHPFIIETGRQTQCFQTVENSFTRKNHHPAGCLPYSSKKPRGLVKEICYARFDILRLPHTTQTNQAKRPRTGPMEWSEKSIFLVRKREAPTFLLRLVLLCWAVKKMHEKARTRGVGFATRILTLGWSVR